MVYTDEWIADYYWVIRENGVLMPAQFASGVLNPNFEPDDYFHKRIVVFEFAP